jgi:hypothetical protein
MKTALVLLILVLACSIKPKDSACPFHSKKEIRATGKFSDYYNK